MFRNTLCLGGMGLALGGLSAYLVTDQPWWMLVWLVGGLMWAAWAKTEAL